MLAYEFSKGGEKQTNCGRGPASGVTILPVLVRKRRRNGASSLSPRALLEWVLVSKTGSAPPKGKREVLWMARIGGCVHTQFMFMWNIYPYKTLTPAHTRRAQCSAPSQASDMTIQTANQHQTVFCDACPIPHLRSSARLPLIACVDACWSRAETHLLEYMAILHAAVTLSSPLTV